MIKVADLTDVKTSRPLLVYRHKEQPLWGGPYKSTVLHISTKRGTKGKNPCYFITNCNLAISHASHYPFNDVPRHKDYYPGFQLCTRCGSQEDFEVALAEYHRQAKQQSAEYKAQRAAEEAQWQADNNACAYALARLADLLESVIPPIYEFKAESHKVTLALDGFRFTVTVERDKRDE